MCIEILIGIGLETISACFNESDGGFPAGCLLIASGVILYGLSKSLPETVQGLFTGQFVGNGDAMASGIRTAASVAKTAALSAISLGGAAMQAKTMAAGMPGGATTGNIMRSLFKGANEARIHQMGYGSMEYQLNEMNKRSSGASSASEKEQRMNDMAQRND